MIRNCFEYLQCQWQPQRENNEKQIMTRPTPSWLHMRYLLSSLFGACITTRALTTNSEAAPDMHDYHRSEYVTYFPASFASLGILLWCKGWQERPNEPVNYNLLSPFLLCLGHCWGAQSGREDPTNMWNIVNFLPFFILRCLGHCFGNTRSGMKEQINLWNIFTFFPFLFTLLGTLLWYAECKKEVNME